MLATLLPLPQLRLLLLGLLLLGLRNKCLQSQVTSIGISKSCSWQLSLSAVEVGNSPQTANAMKIDIYTLSKRQHVYVGQEESKAAEETEEEEEDMPALHVSLLSTICLSNIFIRCVFPLFLFYFFFLHISLDDTSIWVTFGFLLWGCRLDSLLKLRALYGKPERT